MQLFRKLPPPAWHDWLPRLRMFPAHFWLLVGLLLIWWGANIVLFGHWLLWTANPLVALALLAIVVRVDPPTRGRPYWHGFFTYLMPRLFVPIMGSTALFQYNLNWNVRLIGGMIGALWLQGVVLRGRRKRKLRALTARLEREHHMWRAALGLASADETGVVLRVAVSEQGTDGYGRWLDKNYAKFQAQWEGTAGTSPGN